MITRVGWGGPARVAMRAAKRVTMRVTMRVTLAVAGLGAASTPADAQRRAPFVPTAASVERVQPGIDILGYDITLTVAPPSARIEGTEVISLVRRAKVAQLRLDAVGLAISRVLVGSTPVSVQTLDSADRKSVV